jgi:hypothetical protein
MTGLVETRASVATDDGYFPRDSSLLRRVHEQRAVGLLYGQRALAIGATNPLNFVGTISHTRARATPFQRLVKTAKMFEKGLLRLAGGGGPGPRHGRQPAGPSP